jgi:lysozyme
LQAGDLPPVLDVEKDGRLPKKELREAVKKWLDIIEKEYRVKPIIYTGHKFKMKYLNTPIFNNYPNWIAHYYIDSLEFNGNWSFWQHTDYGKVNGINGPVDCNVFNGSIEELMALTIPDTTATSDIQ